MSSLTARYSPGEPNLQHCPVVSWKHWLLTCTSHPVSEPSITDDIIFLTSARMWCGIAGFPNDPDEGAITCFITAFSSRLVDQKALSRSIIGQRVPHPVSYSYAVRQVSAVLIKFPNCSVLLNLAKHFLISLTSKSWYHRGATGPSCWSGCLHFYLLAISFLCILSASSFDLSHIASLLCMQLWCRCYGSPSSQHPIGMIYHAPGFFHSF